MFITPSPPTQLLQPEDQRLGTLARREIIICRIILVYLRTVGDWQDIQGHYY